MSNLRSKLLLPCLLLSSFAVGQEIDPRSTIASDASADGFFAGDRGPGFLRDDPGARFFEILRASSQATERPFSFEETVEYSSVIARGYVVEVIPGRTFINKRRPQIPPIETILLKLSASNVLKGDAQEFYFVEYIAHNAMLDELNEKLFARELLFLLRPATPLYHRDDVEISVSTEAMTGLTDGQPIYSFTLRSSLFTLSAAGNLTSPIDISREFNELYINTRSLDELGSHIIDVQSRLRR